jgi:integrase/recombinase XerD
MKALETYRQGFLKDLEVRNYSPTSIQKYGHCVRLFLGWMDEKGISDFRKIGKPELGRYVVALRNNPKYSLEYVGSNIRAVKCFFRFLKKSGAVFFDFSATLKEPKIPYRRPKEPLTPIEVKKMLEAPDLRTAHGVRDRAIIETFYSTGVRLNEMVHLTLLDLDLENGYLNVMEGKGRKDRTVPLGKQACFFIQNYLETVRPLWVERNQKPDVVRTNRVWIGKRGQPLDKLGIGWMVKQYGKRAGIEKTVTPHAFRRTLAVQLIQNQADFLTVKDILGHSKSSTTLKYCALSGVELKDALRKCHPRYDAEGVDATPNIQKVFVN